jgi:hypothetical protein
MIPTRVVMRGSHNSPPNELRQENKSQENAASAVRMDAGSNDSIPEQRVQGNPYLAGGAELNLIEFVQHRK